MRGPSGEYIKVTALACEICGSESEISPSQATAYLQAVGRRLWERGRAGGGFPGEGRDRYVSPGVYLSTTEGVCRGLFPSGAGRRECFWERRIHQQAPDRGRSYCRDPAVVWAPTGFPCPLAGGKVGTLACLSRVKDQPLAPHGRDDPPTWWDGRGCPSPRLATLVSHHVSIPR